MIILYFGIRQWNTTVIKQVFLLLETLQFNHSKAVFRYYQRLVRADR